LNTRIVFMGTPDFASAILESLCKEKYEIVACITQPDKPMGRHMKLTPPSAKITALSHGIPVFQPNSLRTEEFLLLLKSWEPDLIVTAAYGKILPATVLSVPEIGCLNVHASLLPKYRGAAPVQWALLSGDKETGITIMKMDAGMDTGDILTRRLYPVDPDIHTNQLMNELSAVGAELLLETLPGYLAGTIKPVPQDHRLATLSPPIRKEQGLIDWNQSAQTIHNQIRALSSWPGAYTFYEGERFKIYQSMILIDTALLAAYRQDHGEPLPGTIIRAAGSLLAVSCGSGCLSLSSVQPQSCRRMDASECAHNYHVGIRFSGVPS